MNPTETNPPLNSHLEVTMSDKQKTSFDLLDDQTVTEVLFGGGAGSGKTFLVCMWAAICCRNFPGIRIGLGRNEISNLRKTTAVTMLAKVHPMLGVKQSQFRYSSQIDPGVYYNNGSCILFCDLAYHPSDPDFDRFGSLELTHAIIEEAGEVMKRAWDVFNSRKNRHMNDYYGITGKLVATCNPSLNFLRSEFYDPFIKAGGGGWRLWPHGRVMVRGQEMGAYRAFIKSLVFDNPFIDQNYIYTLENLAPREKKRLMDGSWDYAQDESALFSRHSFVRKDLSADGDQSWAGCDPSRGGDACTFAHIKGATLKELAKLNIPAGTQDIGTYVATEFMKWCQARGIGYQNAAVDTVGIGESVGDACYRLGFKINKFVAGSTVGVRAVDDATRQVITETDYDASVKQRGRPMFDNIRSQNFYDMGTGLRRGEFTIAPDIGYYDTLCIELEAHNTDDRKANQTVVTKKPDIKAQIGHSPDFADAFQAAWWVRSKTLHGSSFTKKLYI